ncbi:ribosomal protein S2, flavodoxin-like domain-containing protein, partial [Catenaria anguillulae PL171]
ATQLTTQDLIAATTHIGHAPSRSTPQTLAYLLGTRQGLHIIDPNATLAHLRRAAAFARLVAANGGIVLFVANDPQVQHLAVEAAEYAGAFYVTQWTPGTLTNAQQVVVKRQAMADTQKQLPTSAPKPDLVVAVDLTSKHTMRAIKEARKLNIPTMAVVDSDVDPRWVTYPIPGNDDSVHSLELVVKTVAQAVRQG